MQLMQVLNDATIEERIHRTMQALNERLVLQWTIEERNHRTTLPMNHFRLGFQQFLTIDDEKTMARGFHTATLKIVGGGGLRRVHS